MAYASVLSVKRQLERLRLSSNPQTKFIYEDLCSIATLFHEKYAQMKGNELRFDPLEEQVEAVANKIEALIEKACGSCRLKSSHTKIPGDETTANSPSSSLDSFQVTQEISFLTEKVKQKGSSTADFVGNESKLKEQSEWVEIEWPNFNVMTIEGLDSEVSSLLHWVQSETANLDIMAVIGDTGTCESTLLQIYTDPSVEHLFEHCLWVTLGQNCNLQELTLVLNHKGFDIERRCDGMENISLVDHLYGFLSEKRYLIVLHNVRSSEMWDLFRPLLPNDWTRSRIILTTLMSNVAHQVSNRFNKKRQRLAPEIPAVRKHHCTVKGIFDEAASSKIEDLIKKVYASCGSHCSGSSDTNSPGYETISNSSYSKEFFQLTQEINSLTEKVKQSKEVYHKIMEENLQQQGSSTTDYVTSSIKLEIMSVVGLDSELLSLLDWVWSYPFNLLDIMAVVGMVGIGKTTLVKQVYNHARVLEYFDIRLWLTVGPSCNSQQLIRVLLQDMGFHERYEISEEDDFGFFLYKYLIGRRYLIVLDDIWSIQSFKELKRYLPNDDRYGSRIILTSRLLDIAEGVTNRDALQKSFLNDEDSWDLLHGMVFTNPGEHCSYELQKYGKKIAKNCEGLPLAILAIGKQLCKEEKTVEYWKEVSEQENLHDIIKDDYESISGTLFMSYKMLPRRLKECFLYIGIVPNYEILVSTLIKLWCAEEFFGPQENKSIEDVAEDYLKEAVAQSVVLVHEQGTREGRIKICRVHFVFRYLCITEAENEKFCLIIKKYVDCSRKGTSKQRRICIHNSVVLGITGAQENMELIPGVCSVLCLGPLQQYLQRLHFRFRMLKVLNALNIRFYEFPHQVLELVRLKYFAMTYSGEIPRSISQLSNLEVLVVGRFHSIISSSGRACMPVEIWNLNWLKHLQCMGIDLLDPCNKMILKHLISLSGVSARSCSRGVFARVPNLKKLGIYIELAPDEVQSFSFLIDIAQQLHNLESFKCVVHGLSSQVVRSHDLGFPNSLIKLTLSGCRFPWNQMATIGGLPHLEVLKLKCYSFCGPLWITEGEEEFPSLRVLLLEDLDIEEWMVVDDVGLCLWRLERLMIRHCYKLRQIPVLQEKASSISTHFIFIIRS